MLLRYYLTSSQKGSRHVRRITKPTYFTHRVSTPTSSQTTIY